MSEVSDLWDRTKKTWKEMAAESTEVVAAFTLAATAVALGHPNWLLPAGGADRSTMSNATPNWTDNVPLGGALAAAATVARGECVILQLEVR